MRCQLLTLVATLAATVLADVKFTIPAAGGSYVGGSTMVITWEDDDTSPSVSELSTYTLNLLVGGNTAASLETYTLGSGTYSGTTGTVSAVIKASYGETDTLAYYLQMVSVPTDGGSDIVYSDRFGMTGMTGTFTTAQTAALEDITVDTDVIADTHDLTGSSASAGAMYYTVAYHLQTGLIKYAPPQPVPPTKITAKGTPTPMNPSTSFTIATTYLSPASITYTQTATQTYTHSSIENTIAAATNTDMKRFLARWVD